MSSARKSGQKSPAGMSRTSRSSAKEPPPTVRWVGGIRGHLSLIDQTLLPGRLRRIAVRDVKTLWNAIHRLAVRGAPAIGVAAAYGCVLGARAAAPRKVVTGNGPAKRAAARFRERVLDVAGYLATSRPTAVNLFWALDRMRAVLERLLERSNDAVEKTGRFDAGPVLQGLLDEALAIHREDAELCRAIGRHGAKLLRSGWTVLTHCNAGSLATGGSGTALSVIYEASRAGKQVAVVADETRPLLQGARLTAWELIQAGVDVTLICDNMAAKVLESGRIQAVVVGADRIASNGDVANKIGTYGVAVLAREHKVPFYVAAPSTTFDLKLRDGKAIPIEERSGLEVIEGFGPSTAPAHVPVYNPAFDVTPARYVTGIITERGVIRPPYRTNIRRVIGKAARAWGS